MNAKRKTILWLAAAALAVSIPAVAWAHACHDFTRKPAKPGGTTSSTSVVASQDDLFMKIDAPDGKLRIAEETTFRVFLINTSEAKIENVGLDLCCNNCFKAEVKPGGDWKSYPALESIGKGGKKQYFDVTLKRNPGLPDGKYAISLVLVNSKNRAQVYKSLDLEKAADVAELPKAPAVKIDGNAEESEWGKAFLGTDFYASVKAKEGANEVRKNVAAPATPSRFRLSADAENLYCLFQFMGAATAQTDEAVLYLAASAESSDVVTVKFDRTAGKVTCSKGDQGLEFAFDKTKEKVECKVPLDLLGLKGAKSFRANFTRKMTGGGQSLVTYWRGNENSILSPLVFCQFSFPGK